jgi:hypothetical protein
MKKNFIFFLFYNFFKITFFLQFKDIQLKLFKSLSIIGKKLVLIILFVSISLISFLILIIITDIFFIKTYTLLTFDNRFFIYEVNEYLSYFTNWQKFLNWAVANPTISNILFVTVGIFFVMVLGSFGCQIPPGPENR